MIAGLRFFIVTLFIVGFCLIGVMGTSTAMTFIWPCYALLGLAAVLAIAALFRDVSFALPRWSTILVITFVGYLLVRAVESPVTYFAREDAALIVVGFVCYTLFLSLLSTSKRRGALIYTLAGLVVLNLLFAGIQGLSDSSFWILPGYERTYSERVGGLFNHPDHFTGFLAVLTPLWLSLAAFGRSGRVAKAGWLALALVSLGTVLVNGGGAAPIALAVSLLGLFAIGVFVAWRNLGKIGKSSSLAMLWGALMVGIIGVVLVSPVSTANSPGGYLTKESGASLPLLWKAGISQVAETPLAGAGGRMSYVYERLFRSEGLASSVADPEFVHNEYIQMLADYGIVGFLLLLGVLGFHVFRGFGFVKAYASFAPPAGEMLPKSDHLALAVGALASLLAIGTLSMFDFVMHLPVFVITAAVLLATLAAPDPMANALKQDSQRLIPGGNLLFASRALSFSCGIVLLLFGAVFSRSEYHYEMARLSFEADSRNFQSFRHLKTARELDPKNPHILSLSAHAQVAGLTPTMAPQERREGLEKAEGYFAKARELYPQDVFSAVGHAAVLDELGQKERAKQRLVSARNWGPLYGNLMRAEAEHHLRHGEISEATASFEDALGAGAFRDVVAAREGLQTISEWKLIAQQNGIQFQERSDNASDADGEDRSDRRKIRNAKIEQREVAGELIPDPEVWFGE